MSIAQGCDVQIAISTSPTSGFCFNVILLSVWEKDLWRMCIAWFGIALVEIALVEIALVDSIVAHSESPLVEITFTKIGFDEIREGFFAIFLTFCTIRRNPEGLMEQHRQQEEGGLFEGVQ